MDLTAFTLKGKTYGKLRSKINQFTKAGITFARYGPPLTPQLLAQAKAVSDSWLSLSGGGSGRLLSDSSSPIMFARRPFTLRWTPKDA